MKKIIIIIAILAATVAAIAQTPSTTTKTSNTASSEKSTVTLYVSFHCQACINRLNKGLPYVKGIVDYRSDLAKKSLKITYKTDKTDLATIKKEIEKMNFVVADSYEELMKKSDSGHCQ